MTKGQRKTSAIWQPCHRSSSETLLSLHPPPGPLAGVGAGQLPPMHRRMSAQPTGVAADQALESRPPSVASVGAVVRVPPLSGEMMESFADLLAIEKGRGFQVSRGLPEAQLIHDNRQTFTYLVDKCWHNRTRGYCPFFCTR